MSIFAIWGTKIEFYSNITNEIMHKITESSEIMQPTMQILLFINASENPQFATDIIKAVIIVTIANAENGAIAFERAVKTKPQTETTAAMILTTIFAAAVVALRGFRFAQIVFAVRQAIYDRFAVGVRFYAHDLLVMAVHKYKFGSAQSCFFLHN